jgi:hypothetical protein
MVYIYGDGGAEETSKKRKNCLAKRVEADELSEQIER